MSKCPYKTHRGVRPGVVAQSGRIDHFCVQHASNVRFLDPKLAQSGHINRDPYCNCTVKMDKKGWNRSNG